MTTEALNARRFRDQPGTYEVWYLTWNHPGTGQGFWLRFVLEAPDHGPARGELWFARFDPRAPERTFGVHRRYPAELVHDQASPFGVTVDKSRLAHASTSGAFDGAGHTIAWDLRWTPAERDLKFLPDLAYTFGIGETAVASANPRVEVTGSIVVDGERLSFDRAVLGQTHVWGKRHAYAWTWAHCADFEDEPTALVELTTPRLMRRGRMLPPLVMVTLDLDGERYRFNQFRHLLANRAHWTGQRIDLDVRSARYRLVGELTCTPAQMVSAPYYDPDGTALFCANTEIGDAVFTLSKLTAFGWQEVRRLVSRGRAHFEIGNREEDPAVTAKHVTVE